MKFTYKTRGVCASTISFDVTDGVVTDVSFVGGCNGNLKAISRLVEGMEAERLVSTLKGNKCGFKNTSCADQLAIAIENALKESGN